MFSAVLLLLLEPLPGYPATVTESAGNPIGLMDTDERPAKPQGSYG